MAYELYVYTVCDEYEHDCEEMLFYTEHEELSNLRKTNGEIYITMEEERFYMTKEQARELGELLIELSNNGNKS